MEKTTGWGRRRGGGEEEGVGGQRTRMRERSSERERGEGERTTARSIRPGLRITTTAGLRPAGSLVVTIQGPSPPDPI